jgi:hypothetical protein
MRDFVAVRSKLLAVHCVHDPSLMGAASRITTLFFLALAPSLLMRLPPSGPRECRVSPHSEVQIVLAPRQQQTRAGIPLRQPFG